MRIVISGLYINNGSDFQGLFGCLNNYGSILNLGVSGSVRGHNYVGAVVGESWGTVSDCYNAGAITGGNYVGGIVGYNGGRVTGCYNTGDVAGYYETGGIAGYNIGDVSNCYNVGTISGGGGVVGYNHNQFTEGRITNSYTLAGSASRNGYGSPLTSEQFADQSAFTGWDFTSTWTMSNWLGRPVLKSSIEGGSGTEEDPYIIPDLEMLEKFRDSVNSGTTYVGEYIKLTDNIDMSESYGETAGKDDAAVSWTPIGDRSHSFQGNFNGGGYEISGLYINNSEANYQGLFGYLGPGGTIHELGVSGLVAGGYSAGGVVGYSRGDVSACYNACTVTGSSATGGVVGSSSGSVGGSYNIGSVIVTGDNAGGVIGYNFGDVSSCYNAGTVEGGLNVGGVIGYNLGEVSSCYNTGNLIGEGSHVGGIVGFNLNGAIVNACYNNGDIKGDTSVGGVVGINNSNATVSSSYNIGFVSGNEDVGGVVGANEGVVTHTYYNNEVYAAPDDMEGATGKTTEQFASGEVTWLLQRGYEETGDLMYQVWGQTLSGETPDACPVLTNDSTKAVLKATFMTTDEHADSFTEYAVEYVNMNDTVTLPQTPSTINKTEFAYWTTSADTAANPPSNTQDNAFDASIGLTEDATVYAVYARQFISTDVSTKIYLHVGDSIDLDLNDYIRFADEGLSVQSGIFNFEVAQGSALPSGLSLSDGRITGTTTTAEITNVSVTVTDTEPYVSLAALDPDPAVVTANLTFSFTITDNLEETFTVDPSDAYGNTYFIEDREDMEALAKYTIRNSGVGLTFKVKNNIDLGGSEENPWTPIGFSFRFRGTFDGDGHKISGLYINNIYNGYQGLFGALGNGGTIRSLDVSGSVTGGGDVGGVVGYNYGGEVSDCCYSGYVTGTYDVGGVVGYNNTGGIVIDCYNTGVVNGSSSYVGGVVGYNNTGGTVLNCYNAGGVNGSGVTVGDVGGVVGNNNTGAIVRNCYNTNLVVGDHFVGGVVGHNLGGEVSGCYNSGDINGSSISGGVVGYNNTGGIVVDCYNTGGVICSGYDVGGVVGYNYGIEVSACYNTGMVSGSFNVGGVIGSNAGTGTVTNSYYNSDVYRDGDSTSGVTGMTTEQFASGEVAYLLQDAQEEVEGVKPQVWGQTLSGETPDQYPALTSDVTRSILKVSFMIAGETEGSYTEYAAAYANPNGTITLPQNPTSDEYKFTKWSQTQSLGGAAFTDQTPVTADTTVYAVVEEMYGSTDGEKKIETTYGTAATQDLSKYMTYAAGTEASGRFTYEITGGNIDDDNLTNNGNKINATIDGDTLTIPADTNADAYTIKIKATAKEPEISLASADYGTEPVSLDVTVDVNKAASSVSVAPTANALTYNGDALALVTAGEAVGGTLVYRLGDEGEYTENIPQATDADTYTVWYMVRGDNNHNDTEPQSVEVTIEKQPAPTATPIATATAAPTEAPTALPAPTSTATIEPTAIPTATATPAPTSTPKPTATIIPTATPAPTEEPTAVPTATPSATATAIPIPPQTPAPTATAVPTATPESTSTPEPTATAPIKPPVATATAAPTEAPTATPAATATAEPTEAPTASPAATAIPTALPVPTSTATPTSTPEQTATPDPILDWSVSEIENGAIIVTAPTDTPAGEENYLYVAKYTDDGILEDIEICRFTTEAGRTEYVFEPNRIVENENVRIMLWDGAMRPLI